MNSIHICFGNKILFLNFIRSIFINDIKGSLNRRRFKYDEEKKSMAHGMNELARPFALLAHNALNN